MYSPHNSNTLHSEFHPVHCSINEFYPQSETTMNPTPLMGSTPTWHPMLHSLLIVLSHSEMTMQVLAYEPLSISLRAAEILHCGIFPIRVPTLLLEFSPLRSPNACALRWWDPPARRWQHKHQLTVSPRLSHGWRNHWQFSSASVTPLQGFTRAHNACMLRWWDPLAWRWQHKYQPTGFPRLTHKKTNHWQFPLLV